MLIKPTDEVDEWEEDTEADPIEADVSWRWEEDEE